MESLRQGLAGSTRHHATATAAFAAATLRQLTDVNAGAVVHLQ
jgi:hypothetical protein